MIEMLHRTLSLPFDCLVKINVSTRTQRRHLQNIAGMYQDAVKLEWQDAHKKCICSS